MTQHIPIWHADDMPEIYGPNGTSGLYILADMAVLGLDPANRDGELSDTARCLVAAGLRNGWVYMLLVAGAHKRPPARTVRQQYEAAYRLMRMGAQAVPYNNTSTLHKIAHGLGIEIAPFVLALGSYRNRGRVWRNAAQATREDYGRKPTASEVRILYRYDLSRKRILSAHRFNGLAAARGLPLIPTRAIDCAWFAADHHNTNTPG